MGKMLDPHTSKLVQAIEEFMENPPRDMPEELVGQLKELGTGLRGYDGAGEESPGMREAASVTNGTGESYKVAATGDDRPSPGQREFDAAMETARQAFSEQTADTPAGT